MVGDAVRFGLTVYSASNHGPVRFAPRESWARIGDVVMFAIRVGSEAGGGGAGGGFIVDTRLALAR